MENRNKIDKKIERIVDREIESMLENLVKNPLTPFEYWDGFTDASGVRVYYIEDDENNRIVVRAHGEKVLNIY